MDPSGKVFDGPVAQLVAADAESKERLEEHAERWAVALLETLSVPVVHEAKAGVGPLTAAWRESDGALTHEGARSSAEAAKSGVAPAKRGGTSDLAAIKMTVDGGDLGEITLVVERIGGKTRVAITVADSRAQAAMQPERGALQRALKKAGIEVESVVVVRAGNVGTSLARKMDAASRARDTAKYSEQLRRDEAERKKRIELIG
jgi:hypothetical protein